MKGAAREKRRRSGSLSAVTEESLANSVLIQAYNRQDVEIERFAREGEGIVQAELASTRIRALFTPDHRPARAGGRAAGDRARDRAVADGRLTVGGLLVFLAYLTQLLGPVRDLSSLANSVFAAAAGRRARDRAARRGAAGRRPRRARRALAGAAGWSSSRTSPSRYPGADRPALERREPAREPGETVALVGPSGAGKSTLAKMVLRLHDPDAGVVRLDGRDVREVTMASLRDNVAVLMQETLVLQASARENIAIGRPSASDAEIRAAARAAGADEFLRALPEGYDTMLDARGRNLSGGQRQRVAIARALVRDAPVLILDEPSTGLDELSRRRMVEPLRRLMRGRASIVISHDLLTVARRRPHRRAGRRADRRDRDATTSWLAGRRPLRPPRPRAGRGAGGGRRGGVVTSSDGPPPEPPGTEVAPGYRLIAHLSRGQRARRLRRLERGARDALRGQAAAPRPRGRPRRGAAAGDRGAAACAACRTPTSCAATR